MLISVLLYLLHDQIRHRVSPARQQGGPDREIQCGHSINTSVAIAHLYKYQRY